jgi:hypothetical protein
MGFVAFSPDGRTALSGSWEYRYGGRRCRFISGYGQMRRENRKVAASAIATLRLDELAASGHLRPSRRPHGGGRSAFDSGNTSTTLGDPATLYFSTPQPRRGDVHAAAGGSCSIGKLPARCAHGVTPTADDSQQLFVGIEPFKCGIISAAICAVMLAVAALLCLFTDGAGGFVMRLAFEARRRTPPGC